MSRSDELNLIYDEPNLAWFWSKNPPALFIGRSGQLYEGCDEIEACGHRKGYEAACEVFMRQVHPYADFLIPKGQITKFYLNQTY